MKIPPLRSRQGRLVLSALTAGLLVVAVTLLVIAFRGQEKAPSPKAAGSSSAAGTTAKSSAAPSKSSAKAKPSPTSSATTLSSSMQITIPAIGVHADVIDLGLNADQTVQVPPLDKVGEAGWYKYSPIPGKVGPSVILGHIDSAVAGKGVFFKLGALHSGDTISVLRPDHQVADFVVSKVSEFSKSAFPTQAIYGNTSAPELRLVTCGGKFDAAARSYVDNIVAFATLKSLHPA